VLTLDERTILSRECADHRVAVCPECDREYRYFELTADPALYQSHLCGVCHTDLTDFIRSHLRRCRYAALAWTRLPSERAMTGHTQSPHPPDPSAASRTERETSGHAPGPDAPDDLSDRIRTCAYCTEPLGPDRISLLAPPFVDFVHAACLPHARALAVRLRLDVVLDAHGWRLVSGARGQGPEIAGAALLPWYPNLV
jgi:hypothetical protein